ncbi:MAG: hypothetical protein QOC80_1540 [Frankiaceae bacterium]|nr:hypothetical protein [Frankiaceae bacterium]
MPGWTPPPLPPRWSRAPNRAFVGRAAETAVLDQAWSAACAGARQLVLVGGEPGAGKSHLLAQTATGLHARGAAILLGTCTEEFGPPYQPFVEPLELLLDALAEGLLDARPGPEVQQRLEMLVGRGPERPGALEHRRQLYEAAVDAVGAAARVQPLVLVLEDLHWAGRTALALLTHLVARTADLPLLVLASMRTTAPDHSPDLAQALAPLYRLDGVRRLDLAGLDADAIAAYLLAQPDDLSPARARAWAAVLVAETGGNPFYLRELWWDITRSGGVPPLPIGGLTAPESVRLTIENRLAKLSTPHRQVIELAAVVGEEVDVVTVVEASDWGHDTTLEALDSAAAHGLLEPVRAPEGTPSTTMRFPHALAREAVLGLLSSARRAHGHARVAQVIEARFPDSDQHVEQLAYHFAAAHTLGFTGKAVGYLVGAADIASRGLAHGDAARSLEQAAGLSTSPRERDTLLLDASWSHVLGSDFARARALAAQVAVTGEPRQRVRAAIAYEAAAWRPGHPGRRSVELLSAGLSGIERSTNDPDYIRALASLGRALALTGATAEAGAAGERAIGLADALGDDQLLADTLQASLWYGQRPADVSETLERATRLTELAIRIGSLGQLGAPAYFRSWIAYLRGQRAEMDIAHTDMLRSVRATGQDFFVYMASCVDYARHFVAGRFEDAERVCGELLDLGGSFGTDDTEGSWGVQTFMVRRETGRLTVARSVISGREKPEDHWAPGLLALYTELGMHEPAGRLLHWILDEHLGRFERSAQWPGVLAFLTEAALELGDEPALRNLRGRLLEYAGLNLVAGQFVAVFGSADRYLGATDSLLGAPTADRWFADALEMDRRMRSPVHEALTLAAQARHLARRQGTRDDVFALVEQARALAEPLGHVRVLRQLETIAPVAVARPVPGPRVRNAGLTERETEVVRLLGGGLSNREIAARLVISENTAANHVRSILAKTGSENRTQAALYASAHGLLA